MSRLQKLIQELCPNGVEYKSLGEDATHQRAKNKNRICENAYSITQRGLIPTNDFFGEKTQITSKDTSGYYLVNKYWFVYSPSRIDVGSISYLRDEGPVIVSPLDVVFSVDMNFIKPDFLLDILLSHHGMFQILNRRQGIEGTGRKTLPFSEIAKIQIPVPPIPVQEEIVRILDNFTELTTELTAELTARKKQYEYYRDKFLMNNPNSTSVKVKDVTKDRFWIMPATPNFISEKGVPYITSKNIRKGKILFENVKYISEEDYSVISNNRPIIENDILISMIGTLGEIAIVQKNDLYFYGQNMFLLRLNEGIINIRYFYHFFDTKIMKEYFNSIKNASSQGYLRAQHIEEVNIPLPPLNEQARIVAILDRFDALCNDISVGLPAEIEARQRQYEYYRDKLLTFKELS